MKIQPKKNSNLPKYAAAIAAAMSAGMLSGYAVPVEPDAALNELSASALEQGSGAYENPEEVELAGVMPVSTEQYEETTEIALAGTSPMPTETTTTCLELAGTSPAITEPTETTALQLAGEPVITADTTEPTELELGGVIALPEDTTELQLGGDIALPEDTTEELRLEGTTPVITETTTEPQEHEHELKDVIRLQKFLLGKEKLSGENRKLADMNGDGEVDVFDLALMKRAVLEGKE